MTISLFEDELNIEDRVQDILSSEVQVARLEMMLEVSRILNSTLDLDGLLQSIIDIAIELIDTEAASVMLFDENQGGFHFQALSGNKEGRHESYVIPLEGSVAGWIIKSSEPLIVDNIQEDERQFSEVDHLAGFAPHTILGVPLTIKSKTIGVLEVLNKQGAVDFNGSDIQILDTLATHAAIAIENARLFKQNDQLVQIFHELRSPMTSIIGFSRLILAEPDIDVDDVRVGLESINREASRLSQMINDFLDLAKIETGRMGMNKAPVNLETLTQEVIDMFYPQTVEKGIKLSWQVSTPIPELPVDGDRLKQVMINLIDNAIKYNHHGGEVTVRLSCNKMRMLFSVQDNGWGIGPEDLALVFDKFYRIQPDHYDQVRGAGLGLALAQKIVEAHGGDIWVESKVDVGSTFTFSLPI